MKNKLQWLLPILFLCISCTENKKYVIEGKIDNLEGKSIFVMQKMEKGKTEFQKIDSQDGTFKIEGKSDSMVIVNLSLNDRMNFATIYIKNGEKISLEGDASNLFKIVVTGNERNVQVFDYRKENSPLLTKLLDAQKHNKKEQIDSLENQLRQLTQKHINKNLEKESSALLLYDYLLTPDNSVMCDTLLTKLSPEAKPFYIEKRIKHLTQLYQKSAPGKILPSFSIYTPNQTTVSSYSFMGKPTLIYFWTVANKTNLVMNDSLKKIYKKHNKVLNMINISMDNDSALWRNQLKADSVKQKTDSVKWKQARIPNTWNHEVVENVGIYQTPFTLLLDKDGKIIARNLPIKQLMARVDTLFKKKKEEKKPTKTTPVKK